MSGINWLASYPKSGNTWLRVLLTNYLRDAAIPADINFLDIGAAGFLKSYFDEYIGIDSSDLTTKQIEHYRPHVYDKMTAESSVDLFLKAHDVFEYNADKYPIFSKDATVGIIYLVRNPLDVAVSYAHHRAKGIDETIRFMADDNAILDGTDKIGGQLPQKLSSWSNHVKSWTDQTDSRVHIIRYEDMLGDTAEALTRIVKFVGLQLDSGRIEKAVRFSRFETLKKQESIHGFKEKQPSARSFFRQGKSGAWKKSLTKAQTAQIISDHKTVMGRFGYLNADKKS